jgi:putative glutathione S-transferase
LTASPVEPPATSKVCPEGGFSAEAGRYHLYVSYACPWAHRTVIFRKFKELEGVISLSVVSHHMRSKRPPVERVSYH